MNNKHKIFASFGLFLLIVGVLTFFFIKPTLIEIENLFDSIQKKKLDIQIGKKKTKELPKIQKQFDLVESQKDTLDVLFQENNIVAVIEKLEKIAEDTNNVISVEIEEESEQGKKIKKKQKVEKTGDDENKKEKLLKAFSAKDYFEMKIILLGDYKKALEFINKLDKIVPENNIKSFKMTVREISEKQKNVGSYQSGIGLLNSSAANNMENNLAKFAGGIVLETDLEVVFYK